jgi:hypothetical protein
MSLFGFFNRKKKTTSETDKVRQGLADAGISSTDMPTDYERSQKKADKQEESKPSPKDPNSSDIESALSALSETVKAWKKNKQNKGK